MPDSQEIRRVPVVRLHLWLDTEDGLFFGSGRAMLLAKIDEHGSLLKAAEDLGISYRAAWGKIKKTEEILGVALMEKKGAKREGYRLTEFGRTLSAQFSQWFAAVESEALSKAQEIFPWPVRAYAKRAKSEHKG